MIYMYDKCIYKINILVIYKKQIFVKSIFNKYSKERCILESLQFFHFLFPSFCYEKKLI